MPSSRSGLTKLIGLSTLATEVAFGARGRDEVVARSLLRKDTKGVDPILLLVHLHHNDLQVTPFLPPPELANHF